MKVIEPLSVRGRAFGDVPGDITGHDERRVVGTGNGDGDVLGGDSELIIGDRHGKDRGDLFAFTEEVERGLEDGVIPGDRAVIGVARHVGDGEGILDGQLLRRAQHQWRDTILLQCGDGGGGFGGHGTIGEGRHR